MVSNSGAKVPIETRQRWGRLASVFSAQSDMELHALIAGLCVLFEDLRLEINGLAVDDLGRLDDCRKIARQLYFLRRSIATLHEFTGLLAELEQLSEFQPVRARFNEMARRHWARANKRFYNPSFPALFSLNKLPSRMYRLTICTDL